MTLAEIMRLALRQLDEDPADIGEFSDLFRSYANLGYKVAVSRFFKPKETYVLRTDDKGEAYIDGMDIDHIVSLKDDNDRDVRYRLSSDGTKIKTTLRDAVLAAVCVVSYPPLEKDSDEPRFPEYAHHALVDYICYRYLMNGNAAKQSRAMLFYQTFEQTMRTVMPQGSGSVTQFRNLYTATDIRNAGW